MTIRESPYAFNPIPQTYDEIMGPAYFEPFAVETASIVASCAPHQVLETACGTGRVTNHLRKMIPAQAGLIATDINTEMLNYAKEKFKNLKNIQWQEADALDLPFQNESFDVVVCQFGAMFFPDKQKGFSEAFRVLKKDGKFICAVWDKLEFNPLASSGRKLLNDFFEGKPPESLRTAFSMADKKQVEGWLSASGFRSISAESYTKSCQFESAEIFSRAFVDGSSVRESIRQIPGASEMLREKICEAVIREFGNHPLKSTMQAILFTGEKK